MHRIARASCGAAVLLFCLLLGSGMKAREDTPGGMRTAGSGSTDALSQWSTLLSAATRLKNVPGCIVNPVECAVRALISRARRLPLKLRDDAEALVLAVVEQDRARLLETLIDNHSTEVKDFLLAMIDHEPSARLRLQIVAHLAREPHPRARRVFERLAKSDPDPHVAVAAMEGLRALAVLDVKDLLDDRLTRAADGDREAAEVFTDAEERWISLTRGTMLPAFLRAPPDVFQATGGTQVRAVAFGDFGTGDDNQRRVADAMRRYHDRTPFDLGLTLGDNFYDDGMESPADARWKPWWSDLYGPLGITFFATLGNHDWHLHDSPAAQILYSARDESWRMPALYYTFTSGPVQFFAIDTNQISVRQLRWLDAALEKSASAWKIVYGHHPIYSDGEHGDHPELIERLLPVLRNRADVYLSGHEHDLQHLAEEAGVHFFISGGGGRSLRVPDPSARALFAASMHGFTVLDADAGTLRVRFVDADLQVLHEHQLAR